MRQARPCKGGRAGWLHRHRDRRKGFNERLRGEASETPGAGTGLHGLLSTSRHPAESPEPEP
eukprot:2557272-Prymnesium_polylepis.1